MKLNWENFFETIDDRERWNQAAVDVMSKRKRRQNTTDLQFMAGIGASNCTITKLKSVETADRVQFWIVRYILREAGCSPREWLELGGFGDDYDLIRDGDSYRLVPLGRRTD